jgi:hypothetical protein
MDKQIGLKQGGSYVESYGSKERAPFSTVLSAVAEFDGLLVNVVSECALH